MCTYLYIYIYIYILYNVIYVAQATGACRVLSRMIPVNAVFAAQL